MNPTPPIGLFARIIHGVLLSILVFIVFQFALASALDGESWQGMQILLTAVIIVPVVALANFWIVPIAWRSKKKAFTAGLLLPAGVGLVEYLVVQRRLPAAASGDRRRWHRFERDGSVPGYAVRSPGRLDPLRRSETRAIVPKPDGRIARPPILVRSSRYTDATLDLALG